MRLLLFLTLSLTAFYHSAAQSIEGVVLDTDNQPIIGADVIHMASQRHTHSNADGKFTLDHMNLNDTLEILYIGYKSARAVIQDFDLPIKIILSESIFLLEEITIGQNVKKTNIFSAIDVQLNPVKSSQEILQKVPGLFIGQHAGGGKAEQIFLRGFDIDHGTDINIQVDGIPVNMVSHAHGQGYSDLHFLIPETIENIDFGKGPYYENVGNFGTAGYVAFNTKDQLESNQLKLELGQFESIRTYAAIKALDTEKHNLYFASEYILTDGPFESRQNFSRGNIFAKYKGKLGEMDQLTAQLSHFTSTWDASGQIPVRSVADGSISRFGAIDDTEGGETSRTNFGINYLRYIGESSSISNRFYYSKYDFELFSNFTFFLNDPVNGDQIRQHEDRSLFGFESVYNRTFDLDKSEILFTAGIGLRSDKIDDNELSRTANRSTTLSRIQLGDVNENNLYAFGKLDLDFGKFLIQPSLRLDYFKFSYLDALTPAFDRLSTSKTVLSPKFNIIYNANPNLQWFVKSGVGFHSNDSRVVLANTTEEILPSVFGVDIGVVFKPTRRTFVTTALWYLGSEQEFVYVGDEGVVEPSGRSRRVGVDVGIRHQLSDYIYINGDFNYARPRSLETPENESFIPLAPMITSTGGITYKRKRISANLQLRYLQDRPANEDNSIVAQGYLITSLSFDYAFKKVNIGFAVENLFNEEWNETQFATASRLQFENQSVEEIHFTPGVPFFFKGIVNYRF